VVAKDASSESQTRYRRRCGRCSAARAPTSCDPEDTEIHQLEGPCAVSRGILYTAAIIVVLFWLGVLVSSRGVSVVARLSSSGTVIGTLIPGAVLVVLGVIYLLQGNSSAAPMDVHHLLPPLHGLTSIVLIVNSFFTYAGVEVNAVHVDELRDPGREYPKSRHTFRRSIVKASRSTSSRLKVS
jgi:amino acid transporter